jgi:hypothetical protein
VVLLAIERAFSPQFQKSKFAFMAKCTQKCFKNPVFCMKTVVKNIFDNFLWVHFVNEAILLF